jgi:SAM-dependent methyltransferase
LPQPIRSRVPLNEIIVCPVCQAELDGVRCTGCDRVYTRVGEVLDLTPDPPPDEEVRRRWGLWEELQANAERAYESFPSGNLAVGEREDARAFGRFCRLAGRVLDIGCGPQKMPSYASEFRGDLLGIDPLLGTQPRRFAFIKGIAEYLPFRDASFDQVLFATSIDHMLSPRMRAAEAARVTKPGGAVLVWHGESEPTRREALLDSALILRRGNVRAAGRQLVEALNPSSKPATTRMQTDDGLLEFDIPDGAVDAFHVEHPGRATVIDWLVNAGLEIEEIDDISVPGTSMIRSRRVRKLS